MANIKSAKKRVLVAQTKTARNKAIRSRVKTMTKKVEAAIAAGDKAAAQASLLTAISEIDRAASKGVFHKNNASRKVARLTKACLLYTSVPSQPRFFLQFQIAFFQRRAQNQGQFQDSDGRDPAFFCRTDLMKHPQSPLIKSGFHGNIKRV